MLIITNIFSFLSFSQNDSLKNYIVDEVIVSASRSEQNVMNTGKSVVVISKEQLALMINFSLGEILEKEAGIHLTGTGQNFGAIQRVFVRGSNSNHLIVMIDGMRISDPSSVDNGIDLSEITISNIERIEIVKGSHSTYFGSSSIGGIVNIVTNKKADSKIGINVDINGGRFGKGTWQSGNNLNLNINSKSGFYASGGIKLQMSSGIDAAIDSITNPATFNERDMDGCRLMSYYIKTGLRKEKTDFNISFIEFNQNIELDKGAFKDDDNRFITFNRKLIQWNASHMLSSSLKIEYSGGYSVMQRIDTDDSSVVDKNGTYDNSFAKSIFDGSFLMNDILFNFQKEKFSLTAGISNHVEKMNNQNYIFSWSPFWGVYESNYDLDSLNLKSNTNALFLHSRISGDLIHSSLKHFKTEIGLRLNHHNSFGEVLTYNINPSYQLDSKTLIFFSLSTGFNAPSLYRLYSPDMGWGAVVKRGNPVLKPEQSQSLEFGFKSKINNSYFIEAVLFRTKVKNVIEYVYLWDKNIGIDTLGNDWKRNDYRGDTYINLSQQNIYGMELKIKALLSKQLYFNGSFTFMNATSPTSIKDIDTSVTSGHHVQLFESGIFITDKSIEKVGLIRRPDAIAIFTMTYSPTEKLKMILNSRFIGHRYDSYYNPELGPYGALDNQLIKGYNLTDISIKYTLSGNFSILFKTENIFNTKYMEINGYSTRPRGYYLGISYKG